MWFYDTYNHNICKKDQETLNSEGFHLLIIGKKLHKLSKLCGGKLWIPVK